MKPIVRFAPSPTGFLHIGSARTALFNWLFARRFSGKFLLRIEDTDQKRSTQEAVKVIFDSLKWLNLDFDDEVVFQYKNIERHTQVANLLLKTGKAYYCYTSAEELDQARQKAKTQGIAFRYDRKWRDVDAFNHPHLRDTTLPVIRFKAPLNGQTIIEDKVQGRIFINNSELDDMVLLRSDGTPTYMLSVIVDDYDMKVTHVIRGDDHLTNTFRQYQVIQALGWNLPTYAHIPLIHGMDGAKLSKRHGAVGCDYYKELGILSEAMCNYLLRLGWSHGNNEIISREQAVQWFDLDHVGQSPSRFDLKKLINLNAHYLRHKDNLALFEDLKPFLDLKLQEAQKENLFDINDSDLNLGFSRILLGLSSLKERSKTLVDLAESALFYVCPPKNYITDIKSKKFLNSESRDYVINMKDALLKCSSFDHDALELCMKEQASLLNVKLSEIAQPLRLALTGKTVSPSLFEIMEILQKDEVVRRLNTFLSS